MLYPTGAAWVSQYNQSNIINDQTQATSEEAKSALEAQLEAASSYNSALRASATLESNANVATGTGYSGGALNYWDLLNASPTGTMARLRIPSIDLDLPVYHGTSESTLQKGVGHLQGTSLPVGGQGTRAVLTGHRGLANATMFTHLDRVKKGDQIVVGLFGEVLTYEVVDIVVVDPEDTEEIRPDPRRDLLTLVTCTPLGVNTQRILITGERINPTPSDQMAAMTHGPDIPGFPWWILILCAGSALILIWYGRSLLPPKDATGRRRSNYGDPAPAVPTRQADRIDLMSPELTRDHSRRHGSTLAEGVAHEQ